ncbi:MAG: alanine--tRNA ligase [Clostridium sp.]|nr:alanine--tRNA ligase [Clostridium sp.]MCM1546891.1 alanine--tRNA ligase [Ruminococcus sp.]
MKWRGVNELREMYLSFFESKSHTRMASSSLIPQGDNSLLLINSGMAPLKKFFLGQAAPPNKRVTTCQKCIRTPDIERVGKTARHGTYFEMLGNFSFGDYFKNEAIEWAWEFFTEVLEIPADRLWVTVFESDDEAEQIWLDKIGIPKERVIRLGKEDNFWEHGSGPCGPCSEIHYDRGEEYGPFESFEQASDCDRVIEIWNLVFSQFDSDGKGNYTEMESKNIDTGMGLERLACAVQGVDNLFEVDTVKNIMGKISEIAGVKYKENENTDVSLRVITDHIRSTTFMVGDGITPANEGRGYVLKRLLRRAARHGKMLGVSEPFLYKVCDTVIDENKNAYPELDEKRELIKSIIKHEEESFAKTIDKGTELLNQFIDKIVAGNLKKTLSGDDAFKLSDTYGFPLDLTKEIAAENGIDIDENRFKECMEEQKRKARSDRASKIKTSWNDDSAAAVNAPKTEFVGYNDFREDAEILEIFVDGKPVDSISEGQEAVIILNRTPFYAESGGQTADTGELKADGAVFGVYNVTKTDNGHFLHFGAAEQGSLNKGDIISAEIDAEKRMAAMRNHTAAHLLQAALRKVLGDHVHQAGQLVNSERCRFDFSHFSAVTPEELFEVENIVNDEILHSIDVVTKEMPIDEARKLGAMALFGEKYGDIVRVVDIGGRSVEFCGGTHVKNTSNIGLFKIISENSVASGVRRIEAVTGVGVLELMNEFRKNLSDAASVLKVANPAKIVERCHTLTEELKEKDKQIQKLTQQLAGNQLSGMFENAKEVNGIKIISALLNGTAPDMLRQIGDKVKEQSQDVIAVFAGVTDEKGTFYCVCGKNAVEKGAHAGKIVQRISAVTGGKGGGRPDSAMAGIGKNYMIDEALQSLESVAAEFIK